MWRWLTGLLLCFCASAAALTNDVIIRQWTAQQGLPNGWVNALLEDGHGNLWAGTPDGLYRLTQSKALAVPMAPGLDQMVNTLVKDDQGFFVGTANALLHWSLGNGLETLATAQQQPLLSPGGVLAATLHKGELWALLGSRKLALWHHGQLSLDAGVGIDENWRQLTSDGRHLFLLSLRQVLAYDPEEGKAQPLAWDKSRYGSPKDLVVDRQKRLWLTSEKGLFQLKLGPDGWQVLPQIQGHYFRSLAEDAKGGFYLTGRYGIQYYHPDSRQLVDYGELIKAQTQIEGLVAITVDRNGLVWAGALGEGVLMLANKATLPLASYSRRSDPALSSDVVWGVLPQPDGTLWLATDAGLEKLSAGAHRLYRPADFSINDGFFAVTPFGDRLAVCGLPGFYLFDPQTESFSRPLEGSNWQGRTCLNLQNDGDSLMIGGMDSLLRWRPGQVEGWLSDTNGKPLDSVKVFARQGERFWGAGAAGLLYQEQGQWTPVQDLPGRRLNAIEPLGDHQLLMGFDKEGLWRLDWGGAEPQWTNLSALWDLPSQAIFFIRRDGDRLYLGMQNTLVLVHHPEQPAPVVEAFFEEDGLPDDELNEGAAKVGDDGTLWVGTAKGVAAFARDSLRHRQQYEDSGVVFLQSRSSGGKGGLYWDMNKLPQLPADLGVLHIQLGSQDYASSRVPQFRYQVSDDSEPVTLYSESPIVLGSLDHGWHSIKVWHTTSGRWRPEPQILRFAIDTPWYRSYPFFSALGLLLLVLSLLFAQQRRRQQQRLHKAFKLAKDSEQQLRLAMFGANANTWSWLAESNSFDIHRPESEFASADGNVHFAMDKVPIHPDDRDRVFAAWNQHLAGQSSRYDVEYRVMVNNQIRWMHVIGRIVDVDEQGRAQRISGIYQDITERKHLEGEVNLYARAFENTAEGVLILGAGREILSGNPAVERICGYDRDQLIGHPLTFLLPGEFLDGDLWQQVYRSGAWTGETTLIRQDGSSCALWLNVTVMDDKASASRHFVVVFSDMTERKAAESELRRLANYDVLTGLPNRAMFMQRLGQALATARSHDQRLALLFMDLDRFKTVNDTYGHRVGDGLLIEAANRLQEVVGDRDTVARLGGDEFVVIIHEVESTEQLIPLCEALLSTLAEPFSVYGRQFFLSTSIGISLYPDDGREPEALLRNADMAMYHAKDEGRNNMQFYCHRRNQEAMQLMQLEADLRLGLEREEFFVVYQPQVDVLEGEIVVALEALARWRHPTQGQVSPDVFIKVAENTGLIAALDGLVLRQAVAAISELNKERRKPLTLSVNISAAHFRQHDFVAQVRQVLDDTGLKPALLCLEITESTLMREVGTAKEHLSALRKLGVSVAVDDFGTGYSSLAYLKQFEVNELKVDKSFVSDLTDSEADAAIVRSVVDLARNLGLKVVAEGVETEEQLDLCLALGCYRVQGFYYARPMALPDLKSWLLDWKARQAS
ncbi:EAL domain-containing protein [Gallaecimonas xiamenensis]|uniref:EAL domain-containing protein n=1 Tax=Gallaecimonas xiamenensis TaxID=1207039 RepID=UPI000A01A414|nr:EAL domain-containing protein [Gallaecimonas xiamenensis]